MRLTAVLRKINYHRHFQRIWKRQNKMEVKEYKISPELQDLKVQIKDAKEILLETKLFKPEAKKTGLPNPLPPSVFRTEASYYRMHSNVKVTESENQILALTKTVSYQGLPKGITSLIDVEQLPNQDELVKTSILQAQIWDAMQDKLPRVVDHINMPGYVFKRAFGIETNKKVASLLEKLSILCDSATGRYTDCFQRHKVLDAYSEIGIKCSDGNVAFQMPCDILLKAKMPLQRFASPSEVNSTKEIVVPNIYPIKPTLDLERWETNPLKDHEAFIPSFGRIHTLFVTEKSHERWLPNQQLAKAIATCFAFTAREAQNIFGADVGVLPEPISVQCMYMDVKSANFIAYQLNTLDLTNNDGVKNQVWIDEPADFYSELTEVTLISDYNPSIFPKMLAFCINGLHPARM